VTTTTGATAADLMSAFKGTPMVMSKAARTAAGALTAVFIVIDVIHMVNICKETGATPTVQELRKMADDLEEEIKCTSNETGEKEEQLNKSSDIAEVNSQKMEETQKLDDLEFFDCREY
jgi:lipid A disaccharide synthetase